jgi:TonB family protein
MFRRSWIAACTVSLLIMVTCGKSHAQLPDPSESAATRKHQEYAIQISRRMATQRFSVASMAKDGTVILLLTIIRDGHLADASIETSSGFKELDAAVLEVARELEPYPPLPPEIKVLPARFRIPVVVHQQK